MTLGDRLTFYSMQSSIDKTVHFQHIGSCFVQKEKSKGQKNPPKNWKVLKERHQQIKQKLKKQADDWMRN